MVEVTFTNPSYLWILILVPFMVVLHFFTLKHSKAAAIKFSNFEAIERVARGDVFGAPYKGLLRNKNLGLLLLRALVYCLLIFSVAGTTIFYEGKASVSDYVLAIDASSSMLADDFTPTRFDAAKEAASNFIEIVTKGANIGIVTFASTSIINLRPTSNLQEIRDSLSDIDLHESGGTAIGDAIITSTNLFNANISKTIILLTDGQNNVGVGPAIAAEYAKQNGVVVHTIGIATKEGGKVSALNLISKLDEVFLEKISKDTSGKFFVVGSIENLNDAFKQITSSTEKLLSANISWILLISAVVLLGLEWMLIHTIYKTIP